MKSLLKALAVVAVGSLSALLIIAVFCPLTEWLLRHMERWLNL